MPYLLITYPSGSRAIQEDTGVHVAAVIEDNNERAFRIFDAGEHDRYLTAVKVEARAELRDALKWLVNEEL